MRRRDILRIEVRAAEIAATMLAGAILDGLPRHAMVGEELVGFIRCGDNRERGTYPKSAAWQAGWLAAIIFGEELDRVVPYPCLLGGAAGLVQRRRNVQETGYATTQLVASRTYARPPAADDGTRPAEEEEQP